MTAIKHALSAVFLILVLLISGARADTALHNINGYTSTNDGIESFSVLLFNDEGRIISTGDDELLAAYPAAIRLDGGGKTVLPGLTDAHAHILGLGLLKTSLDLAGTPSVEDAIARISAYASSRPSARWILGRGWNQVIWPVQEFPTAAHIDSVVESRPVWLRRIDGHAGWANSATLDPVGGKIIRDKNGHATGVLIDKAMAIVGQHVPEIDKDEVQSAIEAAVRALLAEGVTGVHDAGIDLMNAEVYLSMADNNQLDMRIYAMIGGAGDVLDAIGQPILAYGNDRLEIASVKLYSDGALGSRGAAMIDPYSDDAENRGLPFWTQHELDEQVLKANEMGFQVGIHAIGDLNRRHSETVSNTRRLSPWTIFPDLPSWESSLQCSPHTPPATRTWPRIASDLNAFGVVTHGVDYSIPVQSWPTDPISR